MKIYVCRHGSTTDNENNIVQGWKGGNLSDTGIWQAKLLAKEIVQLDPSIIYVSDLNRCKQTYDNICIEEPTLKSIKTIIDKRIRERSYGLLEGKKSEKYRWAELWDSQKDFLKYNIENDKKFRARISSFVIEELGANDSIKTIVIITHGGVLNTLKLFELGDRYIPTKYPNAKLLELDYSNLINGAFNYK